MYKVTDNINDTVPEYQTDHFSEPYIEVLLKKRQSTLKGIDSVMKKLIIT